MTVFDTKLEIIATVVQKLCKCSYSLISLPVIMYLVIMCAKHQLEDGFIIHTRTQYTVYIIHLLSKKMDIWF